MKLSTDLNKVNRRLFNEYRSMSVRNYELKITEYNTKKGCSATLHL